MEELTRFTLNLKAYENSESGEILYFNEDDKETIKQFEEDQIHFGGDWKLQRTINTKVLKVIDNKEKSERFIILYHKR